MTFEFDYNANTEQITIFYDGSVVVKAEFDGECVSFKGFDKIDDEAVESMLKNLCKEAFNILG